MEGGFGNDWYVVWDVGDVVVEHTADASGGLDTVKSILPYTLGFGVEDLRLGGKTDIDGTGNALGNSLTGNRFSNVLKGVQGDDDLYGHRGADTLFGGQGDDRLEGGQGEDRLKGGLGDDAFFFLEDEDAGDRITDFHNEDGDDDRILVPGRLFGLGGMKKDQHLTYDQVQIGESHEAQDRQVRFLLDTRDGTLWSDWNGSKEGGLTLLAHLQPGAELTHQDIWLA